MFQIIKTHSVNIMATVLVIASVLLTFLHGSSNPNALPWYLLLGITVACFAGAQNYWRLLKLKEAPISTIAAAAQGYVELYGRAKCDKQPLKTPYQNIPCVWYRAWVYANFLDKNSDDSLLDNRLLNYEESHKVFTLNDGTAQCLVNPEGAEVVYFQAKTWRKNDHRYVEQYLPVNKPLYVIGQLDTRKDVIDEKVVNQEVREILREMKTRPQQLLNRYDHNLNGQIDMHEWEKAREEVVHQVKAQYVMNAHTGSFTMAKPTDHHLFLISAKSPTQLRAQYRHWIYVHLGFLGLILSFCIKLT
jgi:hypothetical protein